MPTWMPSHPEAVPLLRAARREGIPVGVVARGSRVVVAEGAALEVLWPPARDPPRDENERSLVARLRPAAGTVLLTSDIGSATEARLAASSRLACRVLVVPHHGARGSASARLLDATRPAVVLIPAGPGNLHGHPHPEVLQRLVRRHLPFRSPVRDGRCGAVFRDGRWVPFP
jgi:competence protein ComEC